MVTWGRLRRAELSIYHFSSDLYTVLAMWGSRHRVSARISTQLLPGEWHHLCLAYSPLLHRIAVTVNGRAAAQVRASRVLPVDARPHVYIGRGAYVSTGTSW